MGDRVILSWVSPAKGYQETQPLSMSEAQQVADDLRRKFPQVHETLTVRPA